MASGCGHPHRSPATAAKLISLYRPEESPLQRCQLPLLADDCATMVAQLSLSSTPLESMAPKLKELSLFKAKWSQFSQNELPHAIMANEAQLYTMMSRIPCVGCRRSIERMYGQLRDLGIPALDPIVIHRNGHISLSPHYLADVRLTCALFYKYGTKLDLFIESIPKTKKSRRCFLHSLENQKLRATGNWLEVWDIMERECKEEVLVIEQETLLDTVDKHLTKHRFCGECKIKVLQAFDLLVLDEDPKKEKGFVRSLYDGIRYCSAEKHIHVGNGTDFVAKLIRRAEPELRGSHREKHAKTIDVAQEEILVCIGICLYERLNRINQQLREESQTWQIMFHLCVECLKTNFEVIVEERQGFSQLELVCEEISKAELAKQQKREHKKQKRRLRKNKNRIESSARVTQEEVMKCPDEDGHCKVCDGHYVRSPSPPSPLLMLLGKLSKSRHIPSSPLGTPRCTCTCSCVESGYSSSSAIDSPWNSPSSCNSSDVTCSDTCCLQEEENRSDPVIIAQPVLPSDVILKPTRQANVDKKAKQKAKSSAPSAVSSTEAARTSLSLADAIPTLEDLLRVSHPSDEESYIPPDELRAMQAKIQETSEERIRFRENLRIRFSNLQKLSKFRFRPFVLKEQQPPQQQRQWQLQHSFSTITVKAI